MKRSLNWKWLACLTVVVVAMAAPALAQPEIDYELASVDVLTAREIGQFQLLQHPEGSFVSRGRATAVTPSPYRSSRGSAPTRSTRN